MASIMNEIESLSAFIEPLFPGADVNFLDVPVEPKEHELVLNYLTSSNANETGYHYRLDRTYQVIYFAEKKSLCLQKFEVLERAVNNTLVIPLKDSDRFLRLESFSFSQPFKTESGRMAIIGVLTAHLREARTQVTYEKINTVDTTIN
ncbi:hypothetical protein ACOSZF_20870 [Cytobacillus firmus]|uniref:hypothetical protein n=1 Tax=Cytobacillus firmus TaxID=1399 RepID=UPI003B9FB1B6